MQLTLRIIVIVLIALLLVVAIFGAASGVISQIGDTVTDTGEKQSNTLGCVIDEFKPDDVKECNSRSETSEQSSNDENG